MRIHEILFEMSNLAPRETGLPFTVFVSQRGGAKHDARVKASNPPWGTHPEAVYSIRPFRFRTGKRWLSSTEEIALKEWTDLNLTLLIDYWEGKVQHDYELRQKLISVGDAPPSDYQQAVIAIRASAPKVKAIRWYDKSYILIFDQFLPSEKRLSERLKKLGFNQTIRLTNTDSNEGQSLWQSN